MNTQRPEWAAQPKETHLADSVSFGEYHQTELGGLQSTCLVVFVIHIILACFHLFRFSFSYF